VNEIVLNLDGKKLARLLMGTFDAPLNEQEQWLEDRAKEYWDKCDAGWDYRKVKDDIVARHPITHKELHEAIVAYGRKYRR